MTALQVHDTGRRPSSGRLGRRGAQGLLAAALILLSLSSCVKGYSRYLRLPADPQVASELGWGAVITAYARLKAAPDQASADAGSLRGGAVFVCRERRIDPRGNEAGGYWYFYREEGISGWVNGRDVQVFPSEALARAAAAAR